MGLYLSEWSRSEHICWCVGVCSAHRFIAPFSHPPPPSLGLLLSIIISLGILVLSSFLAAAQMRESLKLISSLLSDPGVSAPRPPNRPGWTDPVRFGRRSVVAAAAAAASAAAAAGHVSLQCQRKNVGQRIKQVVSPANQNYSNATPSWNLLLSQDTGVCLYQLEIHPSYVLQHVSGLLFFFNETEKS